MGEMTLREATRGEREALEQEEAVTALVSEFTKLGLSPVGDFVLEPPAGPALTARLMHQTGASHYVAVVWSPVEGAYAQVTSRFQDGSALTSTSASSAESDADPLDPATLLSSHTEDVRAEVEEGGAELEDLAAIGVEEAFAEDAERLIDTAFEANPEAAELGYIQEALATEELPDMPATRLTAYTDEDLLSPEWVISFVALLSRYGLQVSALNEEDYGLFTTTGPEAEARWQELLSDGEGLLEGQEPVPWQALLDFSAYSTAGLELEDREQVSPFEVTIAVEDPDTKWIDAGRMRSLLADLAQLSSAIVSYCEPFDYGELTYADGLEAGAWLQLHSPRSVEHFGAERFGSSAPVSSITDLGALGELVQLSSQPTSTADLQPVAESWLAHLGRADLPEWDQTARLATTDVWEAPEAKPWAADETDAVDEPLADRRGVEGFSQTYHTLFAQTSPAQLAAALGARRGGKVSGELLGTSDLVDEGAVFVYRLVGHGWSGAVGNTGAPVPLATDTGQAVSAALGEKVILLFSDPSVEAVAYHLWESGELVEQFSFGLGAVPPQVAEEEAPGSEEMESGELVQPTMGGTFFASALRDVDVDAIDDPWLFVDQAFRIQDCYDPSFTFEELAALVTGDPLDAADVPIDPADVESLLSVG